MKKAFHSGLVVGKFAPLHLGHEWTISRAMEDCENVFLISYSKPEIAGCGPRLREQWLKTRFPNTKSLVVTEGFLREKNTQLKAPIQMPANSDNDSVHRHFVGRLCHEILGTTVDAVFTSEKYGDGFARELTDFFRSQDPKAPPVKHVLVDLDRKSVPISASEIRKDVHGCRQWLHPAVYASFVKRITILGGESSGKSTLTSNLAEHFSTAFVPEYGRELWEQKNGRLEFADMLKIAERQIELEESAVLKAYRFLFCDTSPLTTYFYSEYMFGRVDPELSRLAHRGYDLIILCTSDFPFVQDGTRQPPEFRNHQYQWYLKTLDKNNLKYLLVTGSRDNRIQQVMGYHLLRS